MYVEYVIYTNKKSFWILSLRVMEMFLKAVRSYRIPSDREGEDERREINTKKCVSIGPNKKVAILSSSKWFVGNNVVRTEHSSCTSDHRILPRGNRRIFDHTRALQCIFADYTEPSLSTHSQVNIPGTSTK